VNFKICFRGFLSALVVIISVKSAFSQSAIIAPPSIPKAPNSSELFKYQEYPVSMHTGIPSISIPLHTIEFDGIKIPITLNYHAAGIKLHDFPSFVGQGWSLSYGGQISRKVNGKADETISSGFFENQPRRANDIYMGPSFGLFLSDYQYLKEMSVLGYFDTGADVYQYNYHGLSGSFIINRETLEPFLIPLAPHKITVHRDGINMDFDAFDLNGNKFIFGKLNQEYVQSVVTEGPMNEYCNSWMLDEIISQKSGRKINYQYYSHFNKHPLFRLESRTISDQVVYHQYSDPLYSTSIYSPNLSIQNNSFQSTFSFERVPKEISFENGKIVFEYSSEKRLDFGIQQSSYALNVIKVFSKRGQEFYLEKTIQFSTSYFSADNSPESSRLKLDKVRISGGDLIDAQEYSFEYENSRLPSIDFSTTCFDFWGYYNGKNNFSLIPHNIVLYQMHPTWPNQPINIGDPDPEGRWPNEELMKSNLLKKVNYPTGGYSEFEFEANRFLDQSGAERLTGGLRVKKIKSFDGIGNPIVKRYSYGVNESGNGTKNFFDFQEFLFEEQLFKYHNHPPSPPDKITQGDIFDEGYPLYIHYASKRVRTFYSNPSIQIDGFDGAPVIYTEVTEYMEDLSGNNLGKLIHNFSFVSDNGIVWNNSNKGFVTSNHYLRGLPIKIKTFKVNSAGNYYLTKEEDFTYNSSVPFKVAYGGILVKQNVVMEGVGGDVENGTYSDWFYQDIPYRSDDNVLTSKKVKVYDENDPTKFIETEEVYSYNNIEHLQPSQIVSKYGNKEEHTFFKYPADFRINNGSTGNTVLDEMLNKNLQSSFLERYSLSIVGQNSKLKSANISIFDRKPNGTILPKEVYGLKATRGSNYIPLSISNGNFVIDNSSLEKELSINQFDQFGNITEITSKEGIKESFIWAKLGTELVGHAVHVDFNQVQQNLSLTNLNSFGVTDSQIETELNNLRTNVSSNGGMVSTFLHHPLYGVKKVIDVKNYPTFYSYDGLGRLIEIKDKYGNVLKRICYGLNGETVPCQLFGNVAINQLVTRNNCGSGYNGSSTYYSVPANKYKGLTQSEADLLAQNEVTSAGQAYANSVGSCLIQQSPPSVSNFTMSGYTIQFTNITTGLIYSIQISPNTYGNHSQSIPHGIYNIEITCDGFDGFSYAAARNEISPYSCGFFGYSFGTIQLYNVGFDGNCRFFEFY